MDQAASYATEVCACTNAECVQAAETRHASWTAPASPTPDQATTLAALARYSKRCEDRHRGEGTIAKAIRGMRGFTDRMCACKTKACADGVNDDMTKWMQAMSTEQNRDDRPSNAEQQKLEEMARQFGECNAKLMVDAAGAGSP